MMTNEELVDALDALMAYDLGATDSGIHDEGLRERCIDQLQAWKGVPAEDGTHRTKTDVVLARLAVMRLTGGTLGDVRELASWLEDEMRFSS